MFTKLFYTQLDKKALIIDDRMNGGGNVSPMILERLQREVYRMSMSRWGGKNETVPNQAFYGPKVCLIDKYSSSDGDLFPYGFRQLGLGKLIGKRSWGGIVGISGYRAYLDGQDMRTPFFTSYSTEGQWIIEGHGVDPDIVVDINPFEDWLGKDAQLGEGSADKSRRGEEHSIDGKVRGADHHGNSGQRTHCRSAAHTSALGDGKQHGASESPSRVDEKLQRREYGYDRYVDHRGVEGIPAAERQQACQGALIVEGPDGKDKAAGHQRAHPVDEHPALVGCGGGGDGKGEYQQGAGAQRRCKGWVKAPGAV
jgi:hypothetical protein